MTRQINEWVLRPQADVQIGAFTFCSNPIRAKDIAYFEKKLTELQGLLFGVMLTACWDCHLRAILGG
ncbi:hypothetical protein AVO41_03280 [Thiomicrospira sp. WB1]|nr:hypothetical protein AVO41_03280 [Thiomicrospira sp. WB1]